MRRLLGVAVLGFGVGGLGLWATGHHAVRMENAVLAGADAVAKQSVHGIIAAVSGRDIAISGVADSAAERASLLAALDGVPGRRVVQDNLTVLNAAAPFTLDVVKGADAPLAAKGNVPSDTARAAVAAALGDTAAGLTLASGAPGDWAGLVTAGVAGLGPLVEGTLQLRDAQMVLRGTALTPVEKAAAEAAVAGVAGVVTEISVQDDGTPAAFTVDYTAGGGAIVAGKLPKGVSVDGIAAALGVAGSGAPVLALTAPAAGVGDLVAAGLAALKPLVAGQLAFDGAALRIAGQAATPVEKAAAEAAVAGHAAVVTDITALDDGRPVDFTLIYDPKGATTVTGKLPAGVTPKMMAADLGVAAVTGDAVTAAIAGAEGTGALIAAGLESLAPLISGQMRVSDAGLQISGTALGPVEADRARAALAGVAADKVQLDLTVLDDGTAPAFTLDFDRAAGTAQVTGKLPRELDMAALATALGLPAVTGDATVSPLASPEGHEALARGGLAALVQLVSGNMVLNGDGLRITGLAENPAAIVAAKTAVDGLPAEKVEIDLEALDDGRPAAYMTEYSAFDGARVRGKLPMGISADAIAGALGLKAIENLARSAQVGQAVGLPDLFGKLAPFMADFENLRVSLAPTAATVEAEVGPNVDAGRMAAAMAETLGGGVAINVVAVPTLGSDGETRVNPVTGITQTRAGGAWVVAVPEPVVAEPAPVAEPVVAAPVADVARVEACTADAAKAIEGNAVRFVIDSDALDPSAEAALDALARAMAPCVAEAGLNAVIGGHTDNRGRPEYNLGLSQRRAEAVRTALIARGIAAGAMTATGYGMEKAIADNETEAGRAANRRTTVEWVQ